MIICVPISMQIHRLHSAQWRKLFLTHVTAQSCMTHSSVSVSVSLPLRVYFPRQPFDSCDAVRGSCSDPTLSHRRSSHSFTGRARTEAERKGDKHRLFRGQKYNMDLKRGQHFSSAQPWLLPSMSERQSFSFWGPLWNGPCCIVGWVQSIR